MIRQCFKNSRNVRFFRPPEKQGPNNQGQKQLCIEVKVVVLGKETNHNSQKEFAPKGEAKGQELIGCT